MTTVYYNWVPGQTTAFPAGLRMITPGEDVFDEGITPGESEIELSISFQSCWDGSNLDSPDHMSHVAFPEGEGENAPCPSSHPVRIPHLEFFIRWFNTKAAKWRFADGTTRFHADYISGWDANFLQSILDGSDSDFDSKVTFRAGIRHGGDDLELIRLLNDNAVPKADTTCITTEIIDNVINLPRGSCTGTLISPIGNCGSPTAPTPTAPTPTPPSNESECEDSSLKFRLFIKGKGRWKSCAWASKRATDYRCGLDEIVETMCPETCGTCGECVDSTGKFKFELNGRRIRRNCDWVANKKNARCQIDDVALACRDTCGLCE